MQGSFQGASLGRSCHRQVTEVGVKNGFPAPDQFENWSPAPWGEGFHRLFYKCLLLIAVFAVYWFLGRLRVRYSSNFSFILSGISLATGQSLASAILRQNATMKSISSTICTLLITAGVS